MTVDIINAIFETLGGLAVGFSLLKLLKTRKSHGIHWVTPAYFFIWGVWNIGYYASLDQYWSHVVSAGIATINFWYVWKILEYRNND